MIDAFVRSPVHASKDVMHVPDFCEVAYCSATQVMHDTEVACKDEMLADFSMGLRSAVASRGFPSSLDSLSSQGQNARRFLPGSVSSQEVMHDRILATPLKSRRTNDAGARMPLSTVQTVTRRPYRWWKARSVVAENVAWGKRNAGWQARMAACVQEETWWRCEGARRALHLEEAQAVQAKKLECRRLARERRRGRVAAARLMA